MKSIKLITLLVLLSVFLQNCNDDEGPQINEPNVAVSSLNSNLLQEWTDLMLEVERYSSGRPNATARSLAYIYLANYETLVPGMENFSSNTSRLSGFVIDQGEMATSIDWEIAINSSFAKTIDHFMLNLSDDLKLRISTFKTQKEEEIGADLSETLMANSQAWGEYVADQVIAYSLTDTEAESQIIDPQPISYIPPTGEGFWTFSADPERALYPFWESARTFVIAPEETTTVTPLEYSTDENSAYYAEMMEVYDANNDAKVEDGEQLWIAEFWSDDVEGLMFSPPARQFSIANQLLADFNMNMEEASIMSLKLGFSLNDAAVSTWKYKYQYMVMRPSVYIHNNIDPDYQTNLFRLVFWPNPSFPGYPSGHSCFASAASGVFIDFFGDDVNFTDRSHDNRTEFRGTPRSFSKLSDMAAENAFSRIPLGVHIRMDCVEGLRLGYEISDSVNELDLSNN